MNAREDIGIVAEMAAIGARAQSAAAALREAAPQAKAHALHQAANAIRDRSSHILAANVRDLERARDLSPAMRDRLKLDDARVAAMAQGVDDIAALADPVGRVLARWTRPNGLDIARVATPIGVIGMIYESRPNVTADAAALCLKSGNVVILRGGSEAQGSNAAIHAAFLEGIGAAGIPTDAVQLVPTADRAAVGEMLKGLGGAIDLIIPRGGKSLVARVHSEARVPVLAHLEGVCHVYVHAAADAAMARRIVLDAKMRRTSVCGAAETLLIDAAFARDGALWILNDLAAAGCEIRGDETIAAMFVGVKPATEEDWRTEYVDAILAVRVVADVDEAIRHIETYGSHHTEAIVTDDAAVAERFLGALDSAIVLWNASTQFADGGEFGMGAEIGIGTGKLHARGPVGVEQLTTFKYVVRGNGQIRG